MRRFWFAAVIVASGTAGADELGNRVVKNLSELLSSQLGQISLGIVDLHMDLVHGRGNVHVGGGDENFKLRLDGDVKVIGDVARVHARVNLALAGQELHFALPDFQLSTTSVYGRSAVQIAVPLLEGHF